MNKTWLSMLVTLPLISACNDIPVSDVLSPKQVKTIVDNINKQYPDASEELKEQAISVVIRAAENLVFVEGGSFMMGDIRMPCENPWNTSGRIDWSPDAKCLSTPSSVTAGGAYQHKVTLDSYSISRFETEFMDMETMRLINGLSFAASEMIPGPKLPKFVDAKRGGEKYHRAMKKEKNRPARAKRWQEAKDYCIWLGDISELAFDLPTEAQWEYAARSRGENVYFATNNGYKQRKGSQYYDYKTGYYVDYKPEEVNMGEWRDGIDAYPPNPLGIYGMTNYMSEWVNDWFAKDYYQYSPEHNPQGPETGIQKVLRDASGTTMTFSRISSEPETDTYHYSFRCALQQSNPVSAP